MHGKTSIRVATLIGSIAPGFEYYQFWLDGIKDQAWQGELGGFFVFAAILGLAAGASAITVIWFLGYPVLLVIAHIARWIAAPRTSPDAWVLATDRALLIAPYAAGLGVVTWLVYSIGGFGGWPDDVIFGTVGNVIGAWLYVSLFLGWYRAARESRSLTSRST